MYAPFSQESDGMREHLSRRVALGIMLGSILTGIPGCRAAPILIKLPWDRIVSVVLNIASLAVIVKGLLDGSEKEQEVQLSREQIQRLQNGEEVEVELKDGSKQRIRPTLPR
jgi:hypothetical protein